MGLQLHSAVSTVAPSDPLAQRYIRIMTNVPVSPNARNGKTVQPELIGHNNRTGSRSFGRNIDPTNLSVERMQKNEIYLHAVRPGRVAVPTFLDFTAGGKECENDEIRPERLLAIRTIVSKSVEEVERYLATFDDGPWDADRDAEYPNIKQIASDLRRFPPNFNCLTAEEYKRWRASKGRGVGTGRKGGELYPLEYSMHFEPEGLGTEMSRKQKGVIILGPEFWLQSGLEGKVRRIIDLAWERQLHVRPESRKMRPYEDPALVRPCSPHQIMNLRELVLLAYDNVVSGDGMLGICQAPSPFSCAYGDWKNIPGEGYQRPQIGGEKERDSFQKDFNFLSGGSGSSPGLCSEDEFQSMTKDGSEHWIKCRDEGLAFNNNPGRIEIFVCPKLFKAKEFETFDHLRLRWAYQEIMKLSEAKPRDRDSVRSSASASASELEQICPYREKPLRGGPEPELVPRGGALGVVGSGVVIWRWITRVLVYALGRVKEAVHEIRRGHELDR
ncbi:hypothetical protein HOY82DRAFT_616743 [Tuber indicum]|nr:hypothetical protein HOY82DRAFT_616743 [Tuber indicum]